jgi:hypothetical protein
MTRTFTTKYPSCSEKAILGYFPKCGLSIPHHQFLIRHSNPFFHIIAPLMISGPEASLPNDMCLPIPRCDQEDPHFPQHRRYFLVICTQSLNDGLLHKIIVHLTANHQPAVGARDIVREILCVCNAAFSLLLVRKAYLVIVIGLACSSIGELPTKKPKRIMPTSCEEPFCHQKWRERRGRVIILYSECCRSYPLCWIIWPKSNIRSSSLSSNSARNVLCLEHVKLNICPMASNMTAYKKTFFPFSTIRNSVYLTVVHFLEKMGASAFESAAPLLKSSHLLPSGGVPFFTWRLPACTPQAPKVS